MIFVILIADFHMSEFHFTLLLVQKFGFTSAYVYVHLNLIAKEVNSSMCVRTYFEYLKSIAHA